MNPAECLYPNSGTNGCKRKDESKKMSKPLKISPQHGVNPCISVCFFCHEDKEEIALLGKLPGDAKAPMRAVLDYIPCEHCKEKMKQGISLIGVTTTPNNPGQPPIQKNNDGVLYPTGSLIVVKPDAIRRMISDTSMAEDIIKHGVTYTDESIIQHILNQKQPANPADNTPNNPA